MDNLYRVDKSQKNPSIQAGRGSIGSVCIIRCAQIKHSEQKFEKTLLWRPKIGVIYFGLNTCYHPKSIEKGASGSAVQSHYLRVWKTRWDPIFAIIVSDCREVNSDIGATFRFLCCQNTTGHHQRNGQPDRENDLRKIFNSVVEVF